MKKRQKYYVVWHGRQSGIFSTWAECSAAVIGFPGAQYHAFENQESAKDALDRGYDAFNQEQKKHRRDRGASGVLKWIIPSYCVDASCIGNPGKLEYRCVNVETKEVVFAQGPFEEGTNNIGEFLAIVHALAFFKYRQIDSPIYTDSRNAIDWVVRKKCKTRLLRTPKNRQIFDLIDRAEVWLENHSYKNKILKWQTQEWGENPADYGRK